MASITEPPACGHEHQTWAPLRPKGPNTFYVIVVPTVSYYTTPGSATFQLAPGDLLRHDLDDATLQGCAGCEDWLVWSRFHVLTGRHAGACFEVGERNPTADHPMLPRWAGGVAAAPVDDAVAASIRYANLPLSSVDS